MTGLPKLQIIVLGPNGSLDMGIVLDGEDVSHDTPSEHETLFLGAKAGDVLTYDVWAVDANGKKYGDPKTGRLARRTITALVVEPVPADVERMRLLRGCPA